MMGGSEKGSLNFFEKAPLHLEENVIYYRCFREGDKEAQYEDENGSLKSEFMTVADESRQCDMVKTAIARRVSLG